MTRIRQEAKAPPLIPPDLSAAVTNAKTAEDWQAVARTAQPILQAILEGTHKAGAAQVALLKEILNRAYGKPTASQAEKQVAAGVVIIPALGTGETMQMCPRCGFVAQANLDTNS